MAGALVDVLVERLATLALDWIEQELKLVVGVKQEIKNLTKKLEAIRTVLEEAEQRQVMETSVKLWLNDLNDVSYDMDDVLDEWITRVLRHQLEKQEEESANEESANALVTIMKKVCFPFPSSCFGFDQVCLLFRRHEIAEKIKVLNGSLASIDERKQSFGFQNNQNTTRVPELPQRQNTTSLPNPKTFGRDGEKELIVSKLLTEGSEGNEVPLIIPIVGMGGLGKTYLANLVYNDDRVESHFEKRIWVCVSDPFKEIKIAQAIVEGLDQGNVSKNSDQLQILVDCIYKLIKGKKLLLVLDDVWSPKLSQWEELIKPLRIGAMGSRVLVTTRNKDVADIMKATPQTIHLNALSDAFCLSLFYYSANMDESMFHDIGCKIVEKCKGLPLAAKTLGSLMYNKKTIREWEEVLNNKTWELKEIQEDVFRPLLLSYHDLTPAIKHCLLYCVTFPKDYVYSRNRLIELWMSQDYLNANENKEKITVGQNYFDYLVMRSFFQDIKPDVIGYGNIECKIHDIVYDFLRFLTKNECLILDASERRDVSEDKDRHLTCKQEKVRHLTLVHATESESDSLKYSFLPNYKKVRSLIAIESSKNSIGPIFELIVQLKCLRTLSLCGRRGEGCLKEIPEMIGGLIHLRYLDLSRNEELEKLPSALGSLYNLQTLRLVNCESLRKIDVRRLINLRHLYVQGCKKLELIKGIEKLTDLQRLDWFRVPDDEDGDEGNKLEDLKDLNQLQGSLAIDTGGNPNLAEDAAIMVNKAHLLQLRLDFYSVARTRNLFSMNGLKPHPHLESLSISGYEGDAFSDLLSSLHRLRVLNLRLCNYCRYLPPLGKLESLESLHIDHLRGVRKVGVEFLGIDDGQTSSSSSIFISFPKLKQLTFDRMYSWVEWVGVENNNNITIMPCLSQLTIYRCNKLKALPDFLRKTRPQKLAIRESPILQDLYRQRIGEEWAKISHIPTIKM